MTIPRPEALPAWAAACTPIAPVFIDIAFVLWPSFYYGPENGFSAGQWESLREPLHQPPIPMQAQQQGLALSTDCIGHEEALCAHYRDVLAKAARHRKPLGSSAHFWNRPVFPCQPLRQQAAQVQARASGLIAFLAAKLGQDHWT